MAIEDDKSKWLRGTPSWRWMEPTAMIGSEQRVGARRKTFSGPVHAIDPDTRQTLCEKPTDGWFIEEDFWSGMLDRCEACEEKAD